MTNQVIKSFYSDLEAKELLNIINATNNSQDKEVVTNFDWLKTLSVAQMSCLLLNTCNTCVFYKTNCPNDPKKTCEDGILRWLQASHSDTKKVIDNENEHENENENENTHENGDVSNEKG